MDEEGVRGIRYVCHWSTSCHSLLFPTCLFGQTHYFIYASTPLTLIPVPLYITILLGSPNALHDGPELNILLHHSHLVENLNY